MQNSADAHPSAHDDAEMFALAPVSLWLEDYSELRLLFEEWRRAGVVSLRDHLSADPERVKACSQRIRVIKVNRKTLALFEANDLPHLVANLWRLRDGIGALLGLGRSLLGVRRGDQQRGG